VHAVGQVVSFWMSDHYSPGVVVRGLNHFLSEDVAVKGACIVDGDFDVRRRAVARRYTYSITRGAARSPIRERYRLRVSEELDVARMRAAARMLHGVHDFAAFATSLEDGESTVRMVQEARVCEQSDCVEISITANAFLRHQVRNTVGQLLRVGLGRCTVEEFQGFVSCPGEAKAGPAAPARGLCLMEVRYDQALPFAA
jgi:tRNA pseudouridine38-40 synthase